MIKAPFELSLIQARDALIKGELSKESYLTSILDRVAEVDPVFNVFASFDASQVKSDCASIRGSSASEISSKPLWALPIGIKDIIDTSQLPTERGSNAFKGRIAPRPATVVESITQHGGLVLGKTVTTEFAWRSPGKTKNPWNTSHTPGGSSSGSAAGVASKCMPAALGTQTLGSVVRPAAYCGVVGFKPSFGSIPRSGVYPLAHSLDHIGIFTRDVADAAYLASLLIQKDTNDFPHHTPIPINSPLDWNNWSESQKHIKPPKIALLKTSRWSRVSPEQQALVENTAKHLSNAGAEISMLELPPSFECIWDMADIIQYAEAAEINETLALEEPCRISPLTQSLVKKGLTISMLDYIRARKKQQELIAEFKRTMSFVDAVLTTPALGEAPKGLEDTGDALFCTPFTFLGAPAITLPAGYSAGGLPLGIQLASDWGEDSRLLSIAAWAEHVISGFFSPKCLNI
jgi:amidase